MKEIDKYVQRRMELETLGRKLVAVIEDFMPNLKNCVLQDYGRLNEALIESTRLLGPSPSQKKKATMTTKAKKEKACETSSES